LVNYHKPIVFILTVAAAALHCESAAAAIEYSVVDLGDLPGGADYSYATGINAAGQVVGYSQSSTGIRAFLWDSGTMQDLGDLPGGTDNSQATGINAAGQVVGHSQTAGGLRAFLWNSADGMQNLNDLLAPSSAGWTISQVRAINDQGQIVGFGISPSGISRAVLLNPNSAQSGEVPEPLSLVVWSVLALCGCTIAHRYRRATQPG
jgi:probable HAF family extracellular repeat protein